MVLLLLYFFYNFFPVSKSLCIFLALIKLSLSMAMDPI
jgi:hypothetical protein